MKNLNSSVKKIDEFTNKFFTADSRNFLKKIPDCSIDLIITSPPYWGAVQYEKKNNFSDDYEKYINFLLSIWLECERILKPNSKLCINSPIMPIPKEILGQQHTRHIKNINNDIEQSILLKTNLERLSLYIWQKQTSKLMFGSYPYPGNLFENNTIEFINVFVKSGKPEKQTKSKKKKNILSKEEWIDLTQQVWFMIPEDINRKTGHPAPFPKKLPARLMKLYSFGATDTSEGDIILDPFCGIGSTCIVAKKMLRRYIGIDNIKSYIDIAKQKTSQAKSGVPPIYFIGRTKHLNIEELRDLQVNSFNKRRYKKKLMIK